MIPNIYEDFKSRYPEITELKQLGYNLVTDISYPGGGHNDIRAFPCILNQLKLGMQVT